MPNRTILDVQNYLQDKREGKEQYDKLIEWNKSSSNNLKLPLYDIPKNVSKYNTFSITLSGNSAGYHGYKNLVKNFIISLFSY